jgi:hypothetical protein
MNIRVFDHPTKEWDEFASHHSNLIFHQSRWGEILQKGLGEKPLYFYFKNGEIVAGMPAILLDFKLFKVLYSTISYGNYLGDEKYHWYFIEQLEEEIAKRGIDQIRIIDSPFSPRGAPPSYEPFTSVESTCTHINLKGMTEDRLLKSYDGYVRRDIKRAQKRGVTVEEVESINDFYFFYLLYLKSMVRNKAPAKYSRQMVMALRELVMEDRGSLFLARVDGTPVAGILIIYSDKIAHAMIAGSDDQYLKLYPNKLLIHSALTSCIENEIETFDFMGSDKDDGELLRFKKMWGGQPVPLLTYVKDYSPVKCWMIEKGREFIKDGIGARVMRDVARLA